MRKCSLEKMNLSFLCVLLALALQSCGLVPTSGPSTRSFTDQGSADNVDGQSFVLVEVTEKTLSTLERDESAQLGDVFRSSGFKFENTLGEMDSVSVMINDTTTTGETRLTNLPPQEIQSDGTIWVPQLGRIAVKDLTITTAEENIQQALQKYVISPQVLVSVTKARSKYVTLTGDLISGARVAVKSSDTVLDLIADAGGVKKPAHEVSVTVSRKGEVIKTSLSDLYLNKLYVMPGDLISVNLVKNRFLVFGSTGSNRSFDFEKPNLTLDEALAHAGGLLENQSDPTGVFVLRKERKPIAVELSPNMPNASNTGLVPVVYHFNMSKPSSYFLANEFLMKDGDILYVSPASALGIGKLISFIQTGLIAGSTLP